MKRILLLLTAMACLLNLQAQNRALQGTVYDETGAALMGATVVALGADGSSRGGTITDLEGKFNLELATEVSRISVSYIGYTEKTVAIAGLSSVEVRLELSSEQLDEVVVTALGIKKEKKALGYAFTQVEGEELTTNRDPNFINSLSNKIAGVNISQTAGGVGTSSRIVIRGIKSLSSESQPLIVVDGVPMDNSSDGASWLGGIDYGNALMGISPDDIESMSVLKGPNAAALYGSRAAMGVILITTKQGSMKDRLQVTVNSNIMFDRAYITGKYQNEYSAGFGGAIQYQALSAAQAAEHGVDSAYFYHSTGSWGPSFDRELEVLNWNNEFVTLTPQPDNVKDYFENGYTMTNSVAVEKGNENLNWRLSASSLNNKGLKPNSKYDRKTVNYTMNSRLNDMFSVSFKANYVREDAFNRVGQGDSRTGARTFIWMPRSIDMNTLRDDYKSVNGYEQNWYYASSWHTNPYWEAYENYNNDNKDQFNGFAKVDIQLTPWLRGYVRTSMDTYTSKRYVRVANNALRESGEGSYTERWVKYRSLNHDFLLTADQSFGDFRLTGNLGGTYYGTHVDYQSTSIVGLAIPNFFSLNNPLHPDQTSAGSSKSNKVIQSLYGSAQMSYRNWLYAEVTARNDWSSSLPPANWSFFYPSANVSLVFTELLDLNKDVFSFGKLRVSASKVGNDTKAYNLSSYFSSQQFGSLPATFLEPQVGDYRLRSESTRAFELGMDLRFFMSRINLDLTLYDELSFDQIMPLEISKTSGFSHIVTNGGSISNKGIELELNLVPVQNQHLKWDVFVNFAKNYNEVVELAPGIAQYTITNTSQIDVVARPGEPFGDILGSKMTRYYATDAEGKIIDDPNNGKPLIGNDGLYIMHDNQRSVLGNVTPDWTGGVSSALSYKGLSLSFSIGIQRGGHIYSKTNKYGLDNGQFTETLEGRESWYAATTAERNMGRLGEYDNNGNPLMDADGNQIFDPSGSESVGYVADGVLADGTENTRGIDPQVYFHQRKWGGIAELDIYDASYVKLRDLTLNYDFPSSWLGEGFLKKASLALVGKNLWLIHSGTPNIDPESSFTSNNNGLGQEYAAMPTSRSFGFNLRLIF